MLGFIGGSGIYEALPLSNVREREVETPYGEPSAPISVGEFGRSEARSASNGSGDAANGGREVAFVPRHGRDHQYSPTDLPYRANIHALKQLGVTHIVASNAVGSLREDLPPRTLVVPDQIFDRTKHRRSTFFGEGVVVHQSFARPYCRELAAHLVDAAEAARADGDLDADVVADGTYVCIEGPQFSTEAESAFYRSQGWDVIGMTAVPEAKLAREAEIAYAAVTGVTDYDVWKEGREVTVAEVLENAEANSEAIEAVVERAFRSLPADHECECHTALEGAINTPAEAIPETTRERTALLLGDYLE